MKGIVTENSKGLRFKQKVKVLSRKSLLVNKKTRIVSTLVISLYLLLALFLSNITLYAHTEKLVSGTPKSEDEVQLTFTGDISLSRFVKQYGEEFGYDTLFEASKELWKDSDIVFANLESAVFGDESKYEKNPNKAICLSSTRSAFDSVINSGINMVNIANNHAVDYGNKAFENEMKLLKDKKMPFVGGGMNLEDAVKCTTKKIKGLKISFISFSDVIPIGFAAKAEISGIATNRNKHLYKNIREASKESDLVIVYAHWGEEYEFSHNKEQERIAHQLIESGANIVIGSHPHVLQSIENYKDGIIFYSLGNYIFDQGNRDTRNTSLLQINVNKKSEKIGFTLIPMRINNYEPQVTKNKLYVSQIQNSLLRGYDESLYSISDGTIYIEHSLPKKVEEKKDKKKSKKNKVKKDDKKESEKN